MDTTITNYLVNERQLDPYAAERVAAKVQKYEDIKVEFLHWLETRKYDATNPVAVNNYTAAQIAELAPDMDGIGVYNFLTDMRSDPEYGERTIKEGFIVK